MDAVAAVVPPACDIAIVLCIPGDVEGWQAHFCCTGNRGRLAHAIDDLRPGLDGRPLPAGTGHSQHESPPRPALDLRPLSADGLPHLVETTALIPMLRRALEDAGAWRQGSDLVKWGETERAIRRAELETLGKFVDLLEGSWDTSEGSARDADGGTPPVR